MDLDPVEISYVPSSELVERLERRGFCRIALPDPVFEAVLLLHGCAAAGLFEGGTAKERAGCIVHPRDELRKEEHFTGLKVLQQREIFRLRRVGGGCHAPWPTSDAVPSLKEHGMAAFYLLEQLAIGCTEAVLGVLDSPPILSDLCLPGLTAEMEEHDRASPPSTESYQSSQAGAAPLGGINQPVTCSIMDLFYYPNDANRSQTPNCVPHLDPGLIAIAPCVESGHLEVFDIVLGCWTSVTGHIALCGETIAALSKGRFPGCLHRVAQKAVPQLSIVYELQPLSGAPPHADGGEGGAEDVLAWQGMCELRFRGTPVGGGVCTVVGVRRSASGGARIRGQVVGVFGGTGGGGEEEGVRVRAHVTGGGEGGNEDIGRIAEEDKEEGEGGEEEEEEEEGEEELAASFSRAELMCVGVHAGKGACAEVWGRLVIERLEIASVNGSWVLFLGRAGEQSGQEEAPRRGSQESGMRALGHEEERRSVQCVPRGKRPNLRNG